MDMQESNTDLDNVRSSLQEMEDAFSTSGDLLSWTPELLDDIDHCFCRTYLEPDGEPIPSLFFPDSVDNLNAFATYCGDVDEAIRKHSETAPRYAREYFLYYSIWQMRPWGFPLPLGTASVVGVLNSMVTDMKKGFSEVSSLSLICATPSPLDIYHTGHLLDRHLRLIVSGLELKGIHLPRRIRFHGRRHHR